MSNLFKTFKNGIFNENPTFRLVLGMCPTLAVTTSVSNGIGMGFSTTAVLVCSNIVISLIRKMVPEKIRIPAFIVVIATFVTMVDLFMKAFLPSLSESLGLYIPLIVVNCIIFARAESFASKNTPGLAAADGLGMGLGFTLALILLSAVRELIGAGSILGFPVLGTAYQPALLFVLAPGGFLTLGILLGIVNKIGELRQNKEGA